MKIAPLGEQERRDWLRLIRSERIGPITFYQLLRRFGSASKALNGVMEVASGKSRPRLAAPDTITQEMEAAARLGIRFIGACEPDYPGALRGIADAPPILCVAGDPGLFQRHGVAIVGARNASAVGRKMAADLAGDLGRAGLVVVSGLARGIDGTAHQAALETGTIAAVAGGVDVIYPPEHRELTAAIGERGAVVSERAIGYRPTGRDFPRRNRIISGLSLGVIVVEAAVKSGTLITARFALEQGRDVFAVPGSPLDPRCQGTNRLIRDGALLIENAQDVIDALAGRLSGVNEPQGDLFDPPPMETDPAEMDTLRREVLSLLSYTPVHRDILLRESAAMPAQLADILLDLVLCGEVEEHSGGRFSLMAD